MMRQLWTAALAAVLTISTTAAALVAGPVSLQAHAAGYYVLDPTATNAAVATTAGKEAAASAAQMDLTATVTAVDDAATQALQDTFEALIMSGDWTMLSNFTGEDLNVNSMAGGIEALTSYQLTFAGASDAALTQNGQAMVVIPLREVMNGRTLGAGESVQGFLYNSADGIFYATSTVIVGDQLVYYAPYFPANTNTTVLFYVSRTAWKTSAETYDYLAIGNSITLHPQRDFWPNAMGMGASSVEKDYVHIVTRGLTRMQQNVNAAALNYSVWEIVPDNRALALALLDDYLSEDLDLVTIMLGENVITYRGDFATDYPTLIQYIKTKAPNALIVLIGTFWEDEEIETVKMQTAAQYGCLYVSLAAIQDNANYVFGNGSALDANGVRHDSDNPGTAIHPNDAAMSFIANGVLSTVSAAYQTAATTTTTAAATTTADSTAATKADAATAVDPGFTVSATEIVEDTEGQ